MVLVVSACISCMGAVEGNPVRLERQPSHMAAHLRLYNVLDVWFAQSRFGRRGIERDRHADPAQTLPCAWLQDRVQQRQHHAGRPDRYGDCGLPDVGTETRYVGKLGEDDAGRCISANLHALESTPGSSRCRTRPVRSRSSLWTKAGNARFSADATSGFCCSHDDLQREWIVNARALHVDGFETAAATQATAWAREAGIPVIADLDETYDGVDELIANVDYLIVSRDFPTRLTGERNLEQALRKIKNRYGCKLAAATLGADGVIAWDGRRLSLNPGLPRSGGRHDGRGRHFPCGIYLRTVAGLAACAAA